MTDAAPIVLVRFFASLQSRDAVRGRDPEGKPTLFFSAVNDREYSLETARLHHDLPMVSLRLLGWEPAST